jgi:hypothetical protein
LGIPAVIRKRGVLDPSVQRGTILSDLCLLRVLRS